MKLWIWIFLLTCFVVLAVASSDNENEVEAEDRRRRRRKKGKGKKKRPKPKPKPKPKPPPIQWPYPWPCRCGEENLPSSGRTSEESRIVGGTEVERNQYPWLVGLSLETIDSASRCSGVLLNSRWVVTAAHCVNNRVGDKKVWARIGEHERKSAGSQVIQAKQIYLYPYYNADQDLYDIALIWLNSHATIWSSTKIIRPICLPPYATGSSGFLSEAVQGVVAGWGGTKKDGSTFPEVPHKISISILKNEKCQELFDLKGSSAPVLVAEEVCTLDTDGNKDSCTGDSGGPLMVKASNSRFYLHGILSFGGFPCADPGFPAVFARVAPYIQWINYVTNQKSNGHIQYYYCR